MPGDPKMNIVQLCELFSDKVKQCLKRFVPLIAKKARQRNPRINRDVLRLQKIIRRLKKKEKEMVWLVRVA